MTEADGPDATGTATTWTYGWDGASNRISVQVDANTPVETTYNGAGDPVSDTDGNDYTTDGVGNLVAMENTSDPSKNWTYDYDPFSRLVCAENDTSCSGSGAITFALDALDRAVSRTKDSTTTTYRYRGVGEVPAKTTTGGTSTRYANTLAGEPIAQRTGSTTRFFLKDLHGDTVGLVNTLAQDRMSMAFDPWGSGLGTTGTESTWFGFQSDPTDPDTGQVDMGTRWYEGGLGRFITRDALFGNLNDPESLNQFAYATGAPATFVDPNGMYNAAVGGNGQSQSDYTEIDTEGNVITSPDMRRHGPHHSSYDVPPDADGGGACRGFGGCIAHAASASVSAPAHAVRSAVHATSSVLGCWSDWGCSGRTVQNTVGWGLGHANDILRTLNAGNPLAPLLFPPTKATDCSAGNTHATCYLNSVANTPLKASGLDAYTVGHSIICRDCSDPTTRAHELVHVGQQDRDTYAFWVRYGVQFVQGGYCGVDYEREAYAATGSTCR